MELVYRFGGLEHKMVGSLLEQSGTHSPSTKWLHGGTGNPEGDALF